MKWLLSIYRHFTSTDAGLLQYHQIWRFGTTLLTGMFMVKAGWDGDQIGTIELLLFLGAVLTMSWVSGVKNALLSDYPKHAKPQQLISSTVGMVQLLGLGVAILYYLFRSQITQLLCGVDHLPDEIWLAIYLALVPITVLADIIFMLLQKTKSLLNYTHVIYPIQIVLIIWAAFFDGSTTSIMMSLVIVIALKWCWLIYFLNNNTGLRSSLSTAWPLFLLALPLMAQFAIGQGLEFVDGIIVNHHFDRETFAIFRYGARELPITQIMVSSIALSLIPKLVSHKSDAMLEMKKATYSLMKFLFPLSMFLLLASPLLYKYFYSGDFVLSARLFNIYLLILISRILLPHAIMIAEKRNSALLVIAVIELVINVGLSLWLVRSYGLIGIAFGTLIANLAHTIMMISYNKWKLNINPAQYIPIKPYSLLTMLMLAVYFVSELIYYGS